MAVSHEIKSQLAKLLATEDIVVEHKSVETAQFNVHTRVLILPLWEKASNNVYDMLVGHEVGHALFTPDIDWRLSLDIPPSFVNIVEDARIEKLMKRKYPGLAKSFYNGYNELNDRDFFEIVNEDLTTFNLADRANLYFKVGSFLSLAFSTTEKSIINLIKDCETFNDTLSAAEALYNFCKQEKKESLENEQKSQLGSESDSEDSGDCGTDLTPSDQSSVSDTDSSSDVENRGSDVNSTSGMDDFDPIVETVSSLEDSIKELTDRRGSAENVYVELPTLDTKNIIISNKLIHDGIDEDFIGQQKTWDESEHVFLQDLFEETDSEFIKFKKSAQKEVGYLVKEFECRKAADNYARSTTSRTGILSTEKLHTYRFNEDLFKKISVIPDGKNHGLVFILDWSGSMQSVMLDTIKQLYNLLWFCKKVSIPFDVYAFTNNYPTDYTKRSYEKKAGLVLIEETFSLMNLFTSKVKGKVLEEQMKNIFRLACAFTHDVYCPFNVPIGMNLSGTPLNEALICLHQILPQFKKDNKVQKVQCIVLTDGEAAPIRYSREIQRHWEHEPFMGSNYVHDRCIIRNRKTGYSYSCEGMGYWADVTDLLLKDLRQSFLDVNFIGIRVLNSRDAGQFIRRYTGYEDDGYDKIMKRWKKEKSFAIKNSGYHTYFGLASNALANDDEFEVKEDATKAQIKSAFVKSLKSKKMNKKVLGEFIELVA
jgi:hypothetical protein